MLPRHRSAPAASRLALAASGAGLSDPTRHSGRTGPPGPPLAPQSAYPAARPARAIESAICSSVSTGNMPRKPSSVIWFQL
jgi:hypothetical protein